MCVLGNKTAFATAISWLLFVLLLPIRFDILFPFSLSLSLLLPCVSLYIYFLSTSSPSFAWSHFVRSRLQFTSTHLLFNICRRVEWKWHADGIRNLIVHLLYLILMRRLLYLFFMLIFLKTLIGMYLFIIVLFFFLHFGKRWVSQFGISLFSFFCFFLFCYMFYEYFYFSLQP